MFAALVLLQLRLITLGWEPVTTNVDGSPASISAYEVYRYKAGQPLGNPLAVVDKSKTSYVFLPGSAGTWFFRVKAVSDKGVKSDPSEEAFVSIQLMVYDYGPKR